VDGYDYYLPWTTLVIFLFFGLVFDLLFTAESTFVFDPNYDNWRRRVDSKYVNIEDPPFFPFRRANAPHESTARVTAVLYARILRQAVPLRFIHNSWANAVVTLLLTLCVRRY